MVYTSSLPYYDSFQNSVVEDIPGVCCSYTATALLTTAAAVFTQVTGIFAGCPGGLWLVENVLVWWSVIGEVLGIVGRLVLIEN